MSNIPVLIRSAIRCPRDWALKLDAGALVSKSGALRFDSGCILIDHNL